MWMRHSFWVLLLYLASNLLFVCGISDYDRLMEKEDM